MCIHNHKTVRRVLYLSVLAIAFFTSCRDTTCRELARIEQGDVLLGQGNITLEAGVVQIKNSTFVPAGTTLKIKNQ